MISRTYLKLVLLSVVATVVLSLVSLLLMNRVFDDGAVRHRERFLRIVAADVDEKIGDLPVEEIKKLDTVLKPENFRLRPPPPIPEMPPLPPGPPPPPPMGMRGPPRTPPDLWLVDAQGNILVSNAKNEPEWRWDRLQKPVGEQSITSREDFFRLFPGTYVVGLENRNDVFLVVVEGQKPFFGALFGIQGLLTFFTVGMAFLLSISFVYLYLKKKSIEASAVLLRLERGDLKARFEIKRFDEMPGLMVDFNRMAGEIERLVTRIRTSEAARKELLQELGHDLKTPLTSLRTSFETLKVHNDRMSAGDREELFQMIDAEVKYFGELVEKLMTIASLDEPNFKADTETIDLKELLAIELKSRSAGSSLRWSLISNGANAPKPQILGDPHLIMRMLKNSFDNSSRYAKSMVDVEIHDHKNEVEIRVHDDGPGLSQEDLDLFAKRRGRRTRRAGEGLNFSLGLGSVIMKSIAELHGGRLQIENAADGGALLTIWLPKFQSET